MGQYVAPRFRRALLAVACVQAATVALPTLAQNSDLVLEEVVVTARKRVELLQETPISMTAFTADSLDRAGIDNISDFNGRVPGINIENGNGTNGDANIFIRGVGQRETKATLDSGVGIYVDGLYLARAGGSLLDAVDIESIQVLRGPQGTLFGKNTTGGALVVHTKKPGPDLGGYVKATVGNLGRLNTQGTLNLPLIDDKLYSRITLASIQRDGIMENKVDGSEWSDEDRLIGMAQLRWLATDNLIADLSFTYTKTDQRPRLQQCQYVPNPAGGLWALEALPALQSLVLGTPTYEEACRQNSPDNLDPYEGYSNLTTGKYQVDNRMVGLTVSWDVGAVGFLDSLEIKSISGYRYTERSSSEDLDASALPLFENDSLAPAKTQQYSQELQFNGSALDDALHFTTGVYWFREDTDNDWQSGRSGPWIIPSSPTPGDPLLIIAPQNYQRLRQTDNESYAWFGQVDYDLTEHLELTLGARWTWEKRHTGIFRNSLNLASVGTPPLMVIGDGLALFDPTTSTLNPESEWRFDVPYIDTKGSYKDIAWTPMASLKYMAHQSVLDALGLDDGMLYVTYSEGFRSGGLVEGPSPSIPLDSFDSETVSNSEIGVKVDALDRRLRINAAAYYTEYDDIQLTVVRPGVGGAPESRLDNAGKAIVTGAEFESTWIATEALQLTANVSYIDFDVKEFNDMVGGVEVDRQDEAWPRTPRWTGYLRADYFIHTDWARIIPSLSLSYRDKMSHHFDRASYQSGKWEAEEVVFVDASLSFELSDERTTIKLWGKNLDGANNDYLTGGVPLVSFSGGGGLVYAEPRTYGVELTYRFGAE